MKKCLFLKWMEHIGYHNIHELCEELPFGLKYLHEYGDYIVNGQHCALKSSAMNTMKLFISWMLARTKGNTFQLSSQYTLSLIHIKISIRSGKKRCPGI